MDTRTTTGKWAGLILAFFVLCWFSVQCRAAEFYGTVGVGQSTLVLAGPYQWWQPEYPHDIQNTKWFGSLGVGVKANRWVRGEFTYIPRISEKDNIEHVRDECIGRGIGPGLGSDGGPCFVEKTRGYGKVSMLGFSILPQYEHGPYRVFANFGLHRVLARYDIHSDVANHIHEFGSRHWSASTGVGFGYKNLELRATRYDRVIADGGEKGGNGIYNGLTTVELKYIVSFK